MLWRLAIGLAFAWALLLPPLFTVQVAADPAYGCRDRLGALR
jgi:hypothetical protein